MTFLQQIASSAIFRNPERLFDSFRMRLSERENSLEQGIQKNIEIKKNQLLRMSARMEALSPLAVLSRGYAVVSKEGSTVTRAAHLKAGDRLTVRFADGQIKALVLGEKGV